MRTFAPSELIINPDQSVYHLALRPQDIAPTIIAVGDPDRVGDVSRHFDKITFKQQKREFVTHTGLLKNTPISVISSGIGTDNIEIMMNELDMLFNLDLEKRTVLPQKKAFRLVRLGTSGTFREDVELGALLQSEHALGLDSLGFFYDFPQSDFHKKWAVAFSESTNLGFLPYASSASEELLATFSDIKKGNTLTCGGFYAPQGRQIRFETLKPSWLEHIRKFNFLENKLHNFEMETAAYYAFGKLFEHQCLSISVILANRQNHEFAANPHKLVEEMIEKCIWKLVE